MLRVSSSSCRTSYITSCTQFLTITSHLFSSPRLQSSSTLNKLFCENCEGSIPSAKKVRKLFRERRLRQLTNESDCKLHKSFQFKKATNCKLVDVIDAIAADELRGFPDVVRLGGSRSVFVESLHEIPEGPFGDLSGDHGKQIKLFLCACRELGLISDIGSAFDIGGQNIATVNLVAEVFSKPELPCVIVDPNAITPALSPEQPNIKYVVEDALSFFSSDTYSEDVKDIVSNEPSIFILNNLLNVLYAKEAWETLLKIWDRVRPKDFLVISGLVPEQLDKYGLKKLHEEDGIIEYCDANGRFYKSAISESFFDYLELRLSNSEVIYEETFRFPIKPEPMKVSGRRSLTLRKAI